jgi:hypothetical protein
MDAAHDVFEELRAKASHADPGDARQFGGSGGKANGTTNLDELLKQALIEKLNGYAWAELEIPPEEKLLGDLVVPGSRTFLVGTTGLGKTLFGYELVGGMISGKGLLDWKCDRASRWLIVDGEMPTALIKRRIGEVLNRHNPPAENIIIYSLGRAEELASVIPGLDEMPPLNTPEGHEWVMRLVELLEPDGILFDNLMSLAPGDHADGETWRNTESSLCVSAAPE